MFNTIDANYAEKKLNLGTFSQANPVLMGYAGEIAVVKLMRSLGLSAEQLPIGAGYDVHVSSVQGHETKIEVKTARKGKDGKYRFTLYKKYHTDHINSDIVILLAVCENGTTIPYIVPVSFLAQQKQAVITSHPSKYSGKLKQFEWANI